MGIVLTTSMFRHNNSHHYTNSYCTTNKLLNAAPPGPLYVCTFLLVERCHIGLLHGCVSNQLINISTNCAVLSIWSLNSAG